jgi:hypothetical protein
MSPLRALLTVSIAGDFLAAGHAVGLLPHAPLVPSLLASAPLETYIVWQLMRTRRLRARRQRPTTRSTPDLVQYPPPSPSSTPAASSGYRPG